MSTSEPQATTDPTDPELRENPPEAQPLPEPSTTAAQPAESTESDQPQDTTTTAATHTPIEAGFTHTPASTASPIRVDGTNRRKADDGLEGHFVTFTDDQGNARVGAFERVLETEDDGYPKTVLVRTRDEFSELLSLAYTAVRHTNYKGGR